MASSPRGRFSLASLFLLTATVCTLVAITTSSVERLPKVDPEPKFSAFGRVTRSPSAREIGIVCSVAVSVLGAIFGTIAGAFSPRWFRGACLGFFAGALVGAVAGWLIAVPPDWRIVCVGCVLLVTLSLVVRKFSTTSTQSE